MDYIALKQKHKSLFESLSEPNNIRIHRALKWLERSEQETEDDDAKFIFLWIAFNAAYAEELGSRRSERESLGLFFQKMIEVDSKQQLHPLLFQAFSGEIRTLIENKFVFEPFWKALREHDSSEEWKRKFEASKKAAIGKLMQNHTAEVLSIVFDRLYVLRNQLIHGGATWNSYVNRQQVQDGRRIMEKIVPVMIDIMMESGDTEFGQLTFPVIK
ncbi:hypothetical protein GHNINEIG_02258 [Hydrogenovibrio crunogenus]|uniref:Uncharacterized protein n=1 Tax=Hydrogenovibrio crunogenus TaxID=39765 RepID=A0A4P7P1Z9_9GAMM|nr:HEPN domain-containing protein [Hydrogenovibrio crunogenus]QBZ84183.1 hypothetical protein GHNINEIG_02258 [Hydrogenovibrio crunogenus]